MALNLNDRNTKFELLKRSLGLKHKLKVHESLEAPRNHDELANYLLAKWELEDELHAIEAVLADVRTQSAIDWKRKIESMGLAAIHMKPAEGKLTTDTAEAPVRTDQSIKSNGSKKLKARLGTKDPESSL